MGRFLFRFKGQSHLVLFPMYGFKIDGLKVNESLSVQSMAGSRHATKI
jgi:hypothetical protein